MPIQPISGSISTTPQTYDGIWLSNINIVAPTVTGQISVNVRMVPYSTTSSAMAPQELAKSLWISDLVAQSQNSPEIGAAMNAIFYAVQCQIISQSLF